MRIAKSSRVFALMNKQERAIMVRTPIGCRSCRRTFCRGARLHGESDLKAVGAVRPAPRPARPRCTREPHPNGLGKKDCRGVAL
jgi:hypothetical protein